MEAGVLCTSRLYKALVDCIHANNCAVYFKYFTENFTLQTTTFQKYVNFLVVVYISLCFSLTINSVHTHTHTRARNKNIKNHILINRKYHVV